MMYIFYNFKLPETPQMFYLMTFLVILATIQQDIIVI